MKRLKANWKKKTNSILYTDTHIDTQRDTDTHYTNCITIENKMSF